MKRLTGVLVPAVLVLPLSVAPSGATPSHEVAHGLSALQDYGFPPFEVSCASPEDTEVVPTIAPTIVREPAVQAYGQRSLRLAPPEGTAQGLSSTVNSAMTTYGVKLFTSAELDAVGTVRIHLPADPTLDWVGRAAWTQPASTSWQYVDILNQTFTWTSYEVGTSVESGSPTQAPLGAFIQGKSTSEASYGDLRVAFGCTGAPFYLDGLTFDNDGELLFDIEADETTRTRIGNGSDVTTATVALAIRAHVVGWFGTGLPGVPVRLQVKPYGASSFSPVTTKTTNSTGDVTANVTPMKAATYRWIVDYTALRDGSTSPLFPVKVKTKVTSVVADSTVAVGQTIVITGKTNPVKAGYGIQLYREYSPDGGLIKTGTTRSDGTYRITYVPKKPGKYVLGLVVAAGGGNIKSVAPMRTVTVTN